MRYLLYVFVFLALYSCKHNDVSSPPCNSEITEIRQDTSYLSTPIIIPVHLIEDKLNRALQHDLMDENSPMWKKNARPSSKMKIKVSRMGNIEIFWKNNVAKYKVPLIVLVEHQIVPKKMLRLSKALALKTEFSLQMVFETTVNIDKKWKIQPKTKFNSFTWLSKVKIGGIVGVEWIVERKMRRQMPIIVANLDSSIRANVHIDRALNRVWQNIQKPIIINRNKETVWLKINPIRFEMGTITSQKEHLIVQGRILATTETMVGDTPVYRINYHLPPLIKRRSLPDNAYIYMRSEIPFFDINEIISRNLVGKEFSKSGNTIVLKAVEVSSCPPDLVVHLQVQGAVNGDIYFRGTPQYEPDSQRIVIKNFDFDLKSKALLLEGADWLLHDTFKDQMEKELKIGLSDQMIKIPDRIMKGMEAGRIGKKMDLYIEQWDFRPQQIWVRPNDITALIIVNARVEIELEQI